ncbi:DUF84 family protein [Cytobacillus spongiae]|jgi:inosine/xanthosine triphosphatase|uniref:DUF84 family protein n=1 Tax=Cytobacillus spongiae TaxID=2901381 RepID=UPI001F1B1453|nr:DUF84 family protein [Cytobacillus spongiae]UII55234.1 DUF84 family protein [Cytobacillus spongiae]
MRIFVGTKNPVKINAVQSCFSGEEETVISIQVPSGVSEQPFTDDETIKGAIHRAEAALENGKGDIGIGLEGGVQQTEYGLFLCNWGALVEPNLPPLVAGGARIRLPNEIATRLLNGEELGPVMDDFSHKQNVRKNEGAIGIFTNGLVDRSEMFTHVVKLLAGQYEYRKQIK